MPLHKFINDAPGSSITAIHTYLKAPEPRFIIEYNNQTFSSHLYVDMIKFLNKDHGQTNMALSSHVREEIIKDYDGIFVIDGSGRKYGPNEEKIEALYENTETQLDKLSNDDKKLLAIPISVLPWYKFEVYFDDITASAVKMLDENLTSRIFSLGQSPAWIVKAAEHISILHHKNQKFGYIPFSSGSYDVIDETKQDLEFIPSQFKPTAKLEESYNNLLDNLELRPKTIVENYQNHHIKTSIMDFIYSGRGLVSFLSILFSWAKRDGVSVEEMKASLEIVLLTPSEEKSKNSLKFDEVLITCKNQVIEDIEELANGIDSGAYSDRLLQYYPFGNWDKSPQNISENNDFIKELTHRLDNSIEKYSSTHLLSTDDTGSRSFVAPETDLLLTNNNETSVMGYSLSEPDIV